MPYQHLSREDKIKLIRVKRELKKREGTNFLKDFKPYWWQKQFYDAGLKNRQRMLMAANQVGKTYGSAPEFAYHATGLYPDDWEGDRIKCPKRMWALGVTGEQIRDVIQVALCGTFEGGELSGTGAIPRDKIIQSSIVRSPQTKNLVKDFKVRHVSGAEVLISFKAYSQGQHVLMGPIVDFIWIDEEPEDGEIYPQCVIRTANGNDGRGGHVVLSFTPENGMTPLVCQFMEDIQPGQFLLNVTWDDAPHLTEMVRAQLLSAIPEYQRDMRTKGIPVLGAGVIFPISDEDIMCDPFECPDHWLILNGCDFGWDHPQAHIQLWIDPDLDIVYVARAWKKSERDSDQAWNKVKKWSNGVPVAWPADGLQHEKGGGEVLKNDYVKSGFNMHGEHATWVEGGVSVESGLWQMLQDMRDERFKVFSTLAEWFAEKRLYHRDQKGGGIKIVKEKDDLISATRYAYMMKRIAQPYGAIKRLLEADSGGKSQANHDWNPYD